MLLVAEQVDHSTWLPYRLSSRVGRVHFALIFSPSYRIIQDMHAKLLRAGAAASAVPGPRRAAVHVALRGLGHACFGGHGRPACLWWPASCLGVQTFAQHGVNALLADSQV